MHRIINAVATTAIAAGAAWAVIGALGAPTAVVVAAVVVAVVNGVVSGWRGVYDLSCTRGLMAVLADSTWALVTTAAGLVAQCVAGCAALVGRPPGYVTELSRGAGMHVYRGGLVIRSGYAITIGPVVSGAGDMSRMSRRDLVCDHESVHVAQARWWGPLFPVLYLGWMLWGAVRAAVCWVLSGGRGGVAQLGRMVDTAAYLRNPFERQAYRVAAERARARAGVTSSPAGRTSPG